MEELMKRLNEVRPELDFTKETQLIDDGLLDSFDIISIVSMLNDVYDIEIDIEDLEAENFNSATAMWNLITKLQNE